MNKFIFFILFLGISLGYIFDIDKKISGSFHNPFDSIKKFYIDTATSLKETKEKYFTQVVIIEKLQKENKELKTYKLKYEASKKDLESTLETLDNPNFTTNQVKFTKVLSYIDFDDYTKVWLDLEKKDNSILGIISEGFAAGIVVNQDGKAKALLNGNEKSNYAIYVGNNKAPGIIHASEDGHKLVAKFIPSWFEIKKGDEVITSGMDNIFFEGLKVGKVVSIKKLQDIQEATIEPYASVLKQKTFLVYKKIQEKKPKEEATQDKKVEEKEEKTTK